MSLLLAGTVPLTNVVSSVSVFIWLPSWACISSYLTSGFIDSTKSGFLQAVLFWIQIIEVGRQGIGWPLSPINNVAPGINSQLLLKRKICLREDMVVWFIISKSNFANALFSNSHPFLTTKMWDKRILEGKDW